MTPVIAAALLAAATVVACWVSGGLAGVVYILVFAAAAGPGIPLGIALFGRRHPGAWVTGALIGYGATQLALWAVMAAHAASPAAFVLAWALTAAAGAADWWDRAGWRRAVAGALLARSAWLGIGPGWGVRG